MIYVLSIHHHDTTLKNYNESISTILFISLMITTTQFDHLCQLCKLSFTPDETTKLIHQMDDILGLVGKLQDVPLTPHRQSDTHI